MANEKVPDRLDRLEAVLDAVSAKLIEVEERLNISTGYVPPETATEDDEAEGEGGQDANPA